MEHQLKTRSDIHIARKLWHFLGVLVIIVGYNLTSRTTALQLMTFFAFLFVIVDLLRHQSPKINSLVLSVLHPFMRRSERNGMAGTSYLLVGVFIIILLFPKSIATLSLLFLAIADPFASYIGVCYGRDKLIGNKSLQGTFAAFVSSTIISAFYYYHLNLMTDRLLIVSLISGIIGATSELVPIGKLDDNFTLPILSSSMLWVLFYLFGGF